MYGEKIEGERARDVLDGIIPIHDCCLQHDHECALVEKTKIMAPAWEVEFRVLEFLAEGLGFIQDQSLLGCPLGVKL